MPHALRTAAVAGIAALAAIATIIAADIARPASAQSGDETAGRIVARLLDDGRLEFGWLPTGGTRVLPAQRYFPADITHNRWLRSSPVEVGGTAIGWINVRQSEDGRIEFAFTPTDGERILTRSRYFPADARVGSWLRSTEITIDPPDDEAFVVGAGSSLSAGWYHSCGLRGTGAIECWGYNEYGQTDAPAGRFSAVSAGQNHSCGLRETGAVECWGANSESRVDVPTGRFSAVSAGEHHSCGLRETGAVKCWGNNYSGQTDALAGRFSAVSAGARHTCGLRETGTVECWGDNRFGQAGALAGRFNAVSAGGSLSCGLRETGAVECWGANSESRVDVPAGRFSAVSAGRFHSCGLRETGAVECWGDNIFGQTDAPAGRFSAVSAGTDHSCGLRETGAVECWGANWAGQTDVPEDLAAPAEAAVTGCPEPHQLFRVTETTSTTPVSLTRPAHLDTECQVDGLSASRVRPADRYAFTLDRPARVSATLISDTFAPYLFLTDANGQYFYRVGTEREGGTWFSLSESRAAGGEGNAIVTQAGGATGGLQPATFGLRLEPGAYWLFAVSESGPRTGDYRLEVEWERIGSDSDQLDQLDQQIAERFAPVLLFEEGEQYFPVPVELMIQHSTLHYTLNGQSRTRAPGTYSLADLVSYNGRESYLDFPDDDLGLPGARVVYARVAEPTGTRGGTLVQYWFFYLNNKTGESLSSHEGDWESVQLWFDGVAREDMLVTLVPTWMGYAAHEGGWVLSQDAESCAEGSGRLAPSVYVARNRHASYPESGGGGWIAEKVRSLYGLPSLDKSKLQLTSGDQFQGNGQAWALQGLDVPNVEGEKGYEIRLLPEGIDGTWLAWDGRWGDLGDLGLGQDGPRGPAWKEHFWAPPPILPVLKDGWSEASFRCADR